MLAEAFDFATGADLYDPIDKTGAQTVLDLTVHPHPFDRNIRIDDAKQPHLVRAA
jgi:hypothetical protein